jgi:hypothetical protein
MQGTALAQIVGGRTMGSIDPALPRACRRIIEDIELLTLQRAVLECRIAINQSLAMIRSTVDAIAFLDRLQNSRRRDTGHEHQRSTPTSSASRKMTEE